MPKYKVLQQRSRVVDGTAVIVRMLQDDRSNLAIGISVCRNFEVQSICLRPDTLGVVKELTALLDGKTHWALASWISDDQQDPPHAHD